jgi:hypothetical protein
MQRFDDPGLLRRRHLSADRDGLETLRQFLVGQLVYITAEKDVVGRDPNLTADFAGDDIVIAGQDFDATPERASAAIAVIALSFGGSRKAT